MQPIKFIFRKFVGIKVIVLIIFIFYACQERADTSDGTGNTSEDSSYSGLEGTREQGAQVGGSDVKIDTNSAQTVEKAGGPGGEGDAKMSSGKGVSDAQFIADEVAGNYAEIKMGKLGQQKATNIEVKSIAGILITHHTTALNQLKSMASKKNISVPTEEASDMKNKIQEVSAKKENFDKSWCEMLINKHAITIAKYEDMARNASDENLKSWINDILPKLRMHHNKLLACNTNLKS